MTELEKAARMALVALEMYLNMDTMDESYLLEIDLAPKAITALRRALEQPAQHIEHCLWARNGNTPCPHVQPAKPKRPQNCGTGYCSCIECVMESEQPAQQEPVGYFSVNDYGRWEENEGEYGQPLYDRPQARAPLTDEQIDKLPWGPHEGNPMTFAEGLRDFARAIEAAHGIGEKK